MHRRLTILLLTSLCGIHCGTPGVNRPLRGFIDLQGHRGARGLAPENTLPGFAAALDAGVSTLELDVVLTKDRTLVVHHNLSTNPLLCQEPGGEKLVSRPLAQLSARELTSLDCGTQGDPRYPRQAPAPGASPPSLQEFFTFIESYEASHPRPHPTRFNVDLKVPKGASPNTLQTTAEVTVTELRRANAIERSTVQSFEHRILPLLSALSPTLELSALFRATPWQQLLLRAGFNANRPELLEKATALGVSVISPHHRYVNGAFIEEAHRRGLRVVPWTVNSPERLHALFALGVDGIISDYPDLLIREYTRFRQRSPPGKGGN